MTDRPTLDELADRLKEAREAAPVNAVFKHTKSGGFYVVKGHTIAEETGDALIRYEPIGQDLSPAFGKAHAIEFARPLNKFFEKVAIPADGGLLPVARFRRVEQRTSWEYVE